MNLSIEQFVIPSILMGLGIAIDVAVATISRFSDQKMSFRNWTFPVTVAHILLPALGYYSWWFLGNEFSDFALILGCLAFGMISVFIYEAICEWIDAKPIISLQPITDRLFSIFSSESKGRFIIVLAVSMDALWSGPAKAAQAESGQWTINEVFVSFLIAGGVVAIISELSLIVAHVLRRISFNKTRYLAIYLVGGKFLEVTILFAFGLLSLWNGFSQWLGLGSLGQCILGSATCLSTVWLVYWKKLIRNQLNELENL